MRDSAPLLMLSIVVLGLTACATATPINTGNDRKAFLIDCSGSGNALSACIKKANLVCPNGYDIAGSKEEMQGGRSVIYNPVLGTASVIQNVDRNLVVVCK